MKTFSNIKPSKFEIIQGIWGDKELIYQIKKFGEIDILVMADCFYDKQNFPYILATISEIFNIYPSIKRVICVYHHRK